MVPEPRVGVTCLDFHVCSLCCYSLGWFVSVGYLFCVAGCFLCGLFASACIWVQFVDDARLLRSCADVIYSPSSWLCLGLSWLLVLLVLFLCSGIGFFCWLDFDCVRGCLIGTDVHCAVSLQWFGPAVFFG